MFAKLNRDLNAILERDPAAGGKLAAMFLYPSFQVMLAYRCLLYTSPSPRDQRGSRMPSSA